LCIIICILLFVYYYLGKSCAYSIVLQRKLPPIKHPRIVNSIINYGGCSSIDSIDVNMNIIVRCCDNCGSVGLVEGHFVFVLTIFFNKDNHFLFSFIYFVTYLFL
jgi:hypothetical protein